MYEALLGGLDLASAIRYGVAMVYIRVYGLAYSTLFEHAKGVRVQCFEVYGLDMYGLLRELRRVGYEELIRTVR